MKTVILVIAVLLLSFIIGCSGVPDPITPGDLSPALHQSTTTTHNSRYLWGLWKIRISDDPITVDVIPLRSTAIHLNAVRLLEETACTDCISISNINVTPPHDVAADLTITHPYPGALEYTVFDVRGIFITGFDLTFPVLGRNAATGTTKPRLVNADGYTHLFNPTEFPETSPGPPALRYIPGKLAPGGDLSATLNPYIAFAEDAPRRMFEAGSQETVPVRLYVPTFPVEFGYAVNGCWQDPGGPVTDPENDFPPGANCNEAYEINASLEGGLKPVPGSSSPINVEVFDHQGVDTIDSVTAEAPHLFVGEVTLSYSGVSGNGGFLYTGTITNQAGAGIGEYPVLIKVDDTGADPNLGNVDAWHMIMAPVDQGWARTWGGSGGDEGWSVTIDNANNIYVTGHIKGTVDFDPGPGEDIHETDPDVASVFLSKFDSHGNYQWVDVWPCNFTDIIRVAFSDGLASDNSGGIYHTGTFRGSMDFDPGQGEDIHAAAPSNSGMYISKLDENGVYQWTKSWIGSNFNDTCSGVATDDTGHVVVTGEFSNQVDFNPGSGTDFHLSNGEVDVFVSKFYLTGDWLWTRTWGGSEEDDGEAVCTDDSGNIYIGGLFVGTSDFDPGSGDDNHTSNGFMDMFLSKFNPDGDYQWSVTWGGTQQDYVYAIESFESSHVFVTGAFSNTVDFDPGSGIDDHGSNGQSDVYLSCLDTSGSFQWAGTWGADQGDEGYGVASDANGNIYVTGYFRKSVDFDPGPGDDIHISSGFWHDIFLSKFNIYGDYMWARTMGNDDWDIGQSVRLDSSGNAYVTGYFSLDFDFDPGDGVDIHTSIGDVDVFLSKYTPDGYW